jgi:hypothetical protein
VLGIRAFEHIRDRHAPGYADGANDSEFSDDAWDELYVAMATAIREGSWSQSPDRPGTEYEYEFPSLVGWDGDEECYSIRVVVNGNWVTTAYPIRG